MSTAVDENESMAPSRPTSAGDLWIVVPAFNEARVIAETLRGLARYNATVVVVDDGSTDFTASEAASTGAFVLRHATNLGQGAALQTGIRFALQRDAGYICTFDSDGQHDPETIALMLKELADPGIDVVLASRFLGSAVNLRPLRRLVLKAAIIATNVQTGLQLTDTHNGLRLFRSAAAAKVNITQPGMAHGSELLSNIAAAGLRVAEVASVVRYTDYSTKKGQRLSNSFKIAFDLFYAAWIK